MSQSKVFSFGGGVQSMACLVLASMNLIPYKRFVFCNVGHQAENPGTIEYVQTIAKPFAELQGLELTEIAWVGQRGEKRGQERDLYQDLLDADRDIAIPMRLASGAFGNRKCTGRYKIEPLEKWTQDQGATKDAPWLLGLGISWDESQRVADSKTPWHINDYPLIDQRIDRAGCKKIITDAGLPVPEKSSCWFCPFKSNKDWQVLRKGNFGLFHRAVELEALLNRRRETLGKDPAYFSAGQKTLDKLPEEEQTTIDFDGCDSGHCWT
jgi:hypothetical protein